MKYSNQQHFDMLAVFITAVLKFILMDWLNWKVFYLAGIILFWLGYILYRVKTNELTFKLWGFKREGFKQSFFCLAPVILVSVIVSLLYSSINKGLFFHWHFIPVILLYPFWGIIQQFIMLVIVSHHLVTITELKMNRYLMVFIVASLFSLIHYPSIFLMVTTFFMEVLFIIVYFKWKNLWAIGIAHGWIATFILYYVVDRDLWYELFCRF